jgi:hypothetical protein
MFPARNSSPRHVSTFVNPTYDKSRSARGRLPRQPRRVRPTHPRTRAPRPWHTGKRAKQTESHPAEEAVGNAARDAAETTLRALYAEHDPANLPSVPTLVQNWEGREQHLVDRIEKRYKDKTAAAAVKEEWLSRPQAPSLPRIGHPGRELGWLADCPEGDRQRTIRFGPGTLRLDSEQTPGPGFEFLAAEDSGGGGVVGRALPRGTYR